MGCICGSASPIAVLITRCGSIRAMSFFLLRLALTQLSLSTNNVAPVNLQDRTCALLVAIVAITSFSSIFSTVTKAETRLGPRNLARANDLAKIDTLFTRTIIATGLRYRVFHFHKKSMRIANCAREEDIIFFKSDPLSIMM